MPSAQAEFPPELSSVTAARVFLRRALDGWDAQDWEWAASQVVTELATNAVIHAHTRFDLELSFDGEQLKVCVADGSARLPVRRAFSDRATTGRGVTMMQALAGSWGVEPHDRGKTVWCALLAGDRERGGEPELDAFLNHLDQLELAPAAPNAGPQRQSADGARGRAA